MASNLFENSENHHHKTNKEEVKCLKTFHNIAQVTSIRMIRNWTQIFKSTSQEEQVINLLLSLQIQKLQKKKNKENSFKSIFIQDSDKATTIKNHSSYQKLTKLWRTINQSLLIYNSSKDIARQAHLFIVLGADHRLGYYRFKVNI